MGEKSKVSIKGNVFNIQRFSVQDGPGIRTTVFMKGCPLSCLWCSNPESQNHLPEIAHRDSLCTTCGDCLTACKENAIRLSESSSDQKVAINRGKCTNCGECVEACTAGALKLFGQTMTVDEVLDEVRRDMAFYVRSGGGVTIGGGEPLMQPEFVAELLKRCKEIGIHTAIDTCGYAPVSALETVLAHVDLVLFDIKLWNKQQHKRYTGKDNDAILRNFRLVLERNVSIVVRVPLIPAIDGYEDNLREIAGFVGQMNKGLHVDLMPYHRLGENKYKMLDKKYQLAELEPLTEEQRLRALDIFRHLNVDVSIQE